MQLPPAVDVNERTEPELGAGTTLRLLIRSFFLQAAWSYDRMQSVGFATALSGEGRRIVAPGQRAGFIARHLQYFNTNPILASYVLGGVLRIEEDVARGEADPETVVRFKRALASPLAAWGDTLFWATLRPVATAAGAVVILLAGAWGVVLYLLVYNVPHFYYRCRGLGEGYRHAMDLGRILSASPLRTLPARIRRTGLLCLSFGAAFSFAESRLAAGTTGFLLILALSAGVFAALKRRAGLGGLWGLAALLMGLVQVLFSAGGHHW